MYLPYLDWSIIVFRDGLRLYIWGQLIILKLCSEFLQAIHTETKPSCYKVSPYKLHEYGKTVTTKTSRQLVS